MTKLAEVLEQQAPQSKLGRFFGADPLDSISRPWYQGAMGEIEVGKLLARLGPEWTVLHAVPVGTGESDIDHVVIGARGVFTINTKNHADKSIWVGGRTLMVSGQRTDHLRNSVHEAARAGKSLSAPVGFTVPVTGLIVLVGAKKVDIKEAPAGVTVLTAPRLLRWLGKRPTTLSDDAVAEIVTAAKLPGTWHRAPRYAGNPAEIQAQFNQVHQDVQAARRRKRSWGFAGMAAILVAGLAVITTGPTILETITQALMP
ncbi:NERD domain-containing protein [Arthrobacter psychrolactophilus]|uniref:NERD domain-containing protein n=2 Tax=Arthrobacter psychrolactophilus TaxID=92442 RepID=A0A2V5J7P7_9MICC|nr:NERD domain-containing protein [Arthrobacter psychrolactophilus]